MVVCVVVVTPTNSLCANDTRAGEYTSLQLRRRRTRHMAAGATPDEFIASVGISNDVGVAYLCCPALLAH